MSAVTQEVEVSETFDNVLKEEAGPDYFQVTGVFKAYRGAWFMDIEQKMTVLRDGSDLEDCIQETKRELKEKDYFGYSFVVFRKLLPA